MVEFAERIAGALDPDDPVAKKEYVVRAGDTDLRYGHSLPKARAEYASVVKSDPDTDVEEPVLDTFEFNYSDTLFKRFDKAPAFVRGGRLALASLMSIMRLLHSLPKGRDKQKRNAAWVIPSIVTALLVIIGVVLYLYWRDQTRPAAIIIGLTVVTVGFAAAQIKLHGWKVIKLAPSVAIICSAFALDSVDLSSGWTGIVTGLLVVATVMLVLQALEHANDDTGERVQLGIAFAVIAIMSSYSIIIFAGAGAAVYDVFDDDDGSTAATLASRATDGDDESGAETQPKQDSAKSEDVRDPLKALALVLAAGGVTFIPKKARNRLGDAATRLLGALDWIASIGRDRQTEIERVQDLIDELIGSGYERVVVVGYSFGAVIALDAIFPAATPPPRRVTEIKRVITIGCPSKTISSFWPEYWKSRHADHANKDGMCYWTNIYAPLDVLSSKLQSNKNESLSSENKARKPWTMTIRRTITGTTGRTEAAAPLEPFHEEKFKSTSDAKNLRMWEKLVLSGIRAHTHYWSKGQRGAVACFADQLLKDEMKPRAAEDGG